MKWRAKYFDNRSDSEPARVELIEADDQYQATERAKERIGSAMRVDVEPVDSN
jgi:hypothetical protein